MEKNHSDDNGTIFLQPSDLSHEIQCDKKFNIEFYPHFKLSCIYTTVDSYCFSSFFTKTQFEPLITFTFSSNANDSNKYFCFCSQTILAVIKLNEKRKNLICPLLELMTKSFLNPTNPTDSSEFVSYTETDLSNILYPFNLVNHEDTFLEINHFYDYFIQKLNFTPENDISDITNLKSFLSISLKPALLFLLRRDYFPSTWFSNDNLKSINLLVGQISFQFDDFVFLRDLYSNPSGDEALYLYKKSGTLFSIKTYNSEERFNFEREVFITCQSRFIRRMYGIVKDKPNTLVLEFLSNGNGNDVLTNDNLESIMKSKIVTETLLGIDTLNAKGYVLTSFNKKNVYFDRNFCAYISEFDSLHVFNDSIDTKTYIDQRLYFAQFLKDIGGPNFPSIDTGPVIHLFELCTTNLHEDNPTIYSMVYFLRTNHMYFSWSMKDTISQMLQEIFDQQIFNDRKDIQVLIQRANLNNDYDSDLILGLTYRSPQLNIQSTQISFMYWMKGMYKNPKINYQLALYFELMKIPEYYNIISSLANNGHILSQIFLGKEQINSERGLEWLTRASNCNSPESLYLLGTIYEEGKLVNRDMNKAFQFYLKASEQFFHPANYRIGKLLYKGLGIRKNDQLSFSYLSMASLANVADSNYYLSKIYLQQFHLLDINQSKQKMHKIYKILLNLLFNTANNGNLKCQKLITKLSFDESGYYLNKAASTNQDIYSIKRYALTRNEKEGMQLLHKAAKLGDAESLFQIGKYYVDQKNPELGLIYIREAVRLNDAGAQLYLGTQYLIGKPNGIVNQNVVKGITLIQASANQNYPDAYEKMGEIFLENNYIPCKYDLALYYLDFAFRRKTAHAPYYLGLMYEHGLGREKDLEKAKKIYSNFTNDLNSLIRLSHLDKQIDLIQLNISNSRLNAEILRSSQIESEITKKEQMSTGINQPTKDLDKNINPELTKNSHVNFDFNKPNENESQNNAKLDQKDLPLPKDIINITKVNPSLNSKKNNQIDNVQKNKKNESIKSTGIKQMADFFSFIIKEPPVDDDGDYQGLFNQARLIEHGMEPTIDGNPKKAFSLYKKCAIEGNNVDAIYRLGQCYEKGYGVRQDYKAAFRWYISACYYKEDDSFGDDLIYYDDSYYYDECQNEAFSDLGVLEKLKQISMNKSIKQSQVNSFYKAGMMLYRGLGVNSRNLPRAQHFLLRAAEHNHIDAFCELAFLYFECNDFENCIYYAQKASDGDNPYAQLLLAYLYHDGIGVDKNMDMYRFILSNNNSQISEYCYLIGRHYEIELDDINNAYKWYQKGAENGNKNCLFKLGQMHYEGTYQNKPNYPESIKYFKKIFNDVKDNNVVLINTNNSTKKYQFDGFDDDSFYVNDFIQKFNEYKLHEDEYLDFNMYLKINKIKLRSMLPKPKLESIKQKQILYDNAEIPFCIPILNATTCNEQIASFYIAQMYSTGGNGLDLMTPNAAHWYKISAELGNSVAMYYYAKMLETKSPGVLGSGHLPNIDHELSYEWFSLAAKRGESKAFGKVMHMSACGIHRKKTYSSIFQLQEVIEKYKDVDAMVELADLFYYGNPTSNGAPYRDVQKALELYQIAADMNSSTAQYRLAVIYEASDKQKAAMLFEKSAKGDNLPSMVFVADIYNKAKQFDQALRWYKRCSNAGLTHAKIVIGRMYAEGQGAEKDRKMAEEYFKDAMQDGSAEGIFEWAKLQIEDKQPDFKKIMRLLYQSADGRCGEAMNMIGLMYREGLGVPVDEFLAKIWFDRGSNCGFNQATLNLAKMYYEGYKYRRPKMNSKNDNKDLPKAIELFKKASKKGSIVAKLYLAKIIRNGEGCQKDSIQAGQLYMEAAKMEGMDSTEAGLEDLRLAMGCRNPAACNIIADRILLGLDNGLEDNPLTEVPCKVDDTLLKRAYSLFTIAAKVNITNALYQLGQMTENGKGTKKNMEKAINFYKSAAEEGSEIALKRLHEISPETKVKRIEDCPTTKTGDRLIKMHAYECLTCNITNTHAICAKCANTCHRNHELIDIGTKNNVFCCCTLCRGTL